MKDITTVFTHVANKFNKESSTVQSRIFKSLDILGVGNFVIGQYIRILAYQLPSKINLRCYIVISADVYVYNDDTCIVSLSTINLDKLKKLSKLGKHCFKEADMTKFVGHVTFKENSITEKYHKKMFCTEDSKNQIVIKSDDKTRLYNFDFKDEYLIFEKI